MKLKVLACWWCCGGLEPQGNEARDTGAVSEGNSQVQMESRGAEQQHLKQLRTEVQTFLGRQQATAKVPTATEEVVVGVDYLPVYLERAGRLKFNGIKVKITFTEERLKKPASLD